MMPARSSLMMEHVPFVTKCSLRGNRFYMWCFYFLLFKLAIAYMCWSEHGEWDIKECEVISSLVADSNGRFNPTDQLYFEGKARPQHR